ncbi:enhancer of yellow 2b transcription factor-like [Drosophila montana]|uniref:enhancer of yellow 2b transcription factor-like n=1 Tax=Drosophila montana TaxID=40370 RepID=UPI00313BFF75
MADSQESFTSAQTPTDEVQTSGVDVNNPNALRELLQLRLQECGWYDSIRKMIRSILIKRGARNVTYEEIHAEIVPKARALVPEEVRKELQLIVRDALESTKR